MGKERKSLISQFAIIGSGGLIAILLGFFNAPIITRLVSPEEYGQYSLFLTYGNLALSFLYLAMDQSLIRYFYEENSDVYKSTLLRKTLGISLKSVIISTFIFYILMLLDIINFTLDKTMFFLLAIYIFTLVLQRFSFLIIRLRFKSGIYSRNNILNKLFYILLAIPLVLLNSNNKSYSLIMATIISTFLITVIAIYSEKDLWNFSNFKKNVPKIDNGKLLRYSLPLVLSLAMTSLFNANDKLFLDYYSSHEELGIFSAANSMIVLLNIFQTTFNTIWAPAAIEHYSKYPDDKDYHYNGNQVITVVMFIVGLTVILMKDIFILFLGEQFSEASFIIPGLVFGPIMYTISETTISGIVFKEKSKMHVLVAMGSLIVGVIANFLLVPIFGGVGAALGTGITYIIFFTLRTLVSNRYYYVNFNLIKFYILTFVSFGYAIYNSFVSFNVFTIIGYIICILLLIIFYHQTIKKIIVKGIEYVGLKELSNRT